MGDLKNCTWESIKGIAENIFNIQLDGADLTWAKKAWEIIERTPLHRYSNEQEYYLVLIRLFCLGEMCHIYYDLAADDGYEAHEKYSEWVDYSELQKIRFILLAGEKFYEDYYFDDGFTEVIDYLIEQEYSRVAELLINGFGNENKLLEALRGQSDEDGGMTLTYEEALNAGYDPLNAPVSNETFRLFEWKQDGFSRSYQ